MGRESLERLRASRGMRTGRVRAESVLLVCSKCEQRLLKDGRFRQAGELREEFGVAEAAGLQVLRVECLDVCPEGAVAVCTGARPGTGAETHVVRTRDDVRAVSEASLVEGLSAASLQS